MPIYEYECLKCGKTHEVIQKFSDAPLTVCPECKGRLKKLISPSTFVLKGSGWYVTDYASPDRKRAKESEKTNGKKSDKAAKKEEKAETKTEAKAETKTEAKTESKKNSTSSDK
ncbi:MAG TPA: FmdB family zinc ribbon protein [Dissulfurispiraceae bacterium]